MAVDPHSHISPIHLIASTLAIIAIFGTLHLLALSMPDSRAARAFLGLGF